MASTDSQSRYILPVNKIKKRKLDSHHIYDIEMISPNLIITDMKIYLGLPVGTEYSVQYKLIVKIFGNKGDLLYFNTFEE